jgi:hypothetical protein
VKDKIITLFCALLAYGGLAYMILLGFWGWYSDDGSEKVERKFVESNETKFSLPLLISPTWIEINGTFENKDDANSLTRRFPNYKVISEGSFPAIHRSITEPNATEVKHFSPEEMLFGVGDRVSFSTFDEIGWLEKPPYRYYTSISSQRTIEIEKIMFSNELTHIVVEGVDANGTRSHFYVSPEPSKE